MVVLVFGMGFFVIIIEKLFLEVELIIFLEIMEKLLNRKVDVIIFIEIGGINLFMFIVVVVKKGFFILDVDFMGRVFFEV